MIGQPDDQQCRHSELVVEVRRPLHRPNPARRFAARWRVRREARRARKADKTRLRWWDVLDLPSVDGDVIGAILFAIVAVILLVLFVIVVGPLLWIVLLLLVELLVWVVLAIAGLIAWLVLRRPWRVAVVDPEGTTLASSAVRGRRAARRHAVVVERRLGDGATPTAAVTTP